MIGAAAALFVAAPEGGQSVNEAFVATSNAEASLDSVAPKLTNLGQNAPTDNLIRVGGLPGQWDAGSAARFKKLQRKLLERGLSAEERSEFQGLRLLRSAPRNDEEAEKVATLVIVEKVHRELLAKLKEYVSVIEAAVPPSSYASNRNHSA